MKHKESTTEVSELLGAEEALRVSEEKYRTLFNSMFNSIDQGFCIVEVLFDGGGEANDFRFLAANPAFEKMTGTRGAVGRTAREVVPDLDPAWCQAAVNVALTGVPTRIEQPVEALGRVFEVYGFRVGAPEQRRAGALFHEITERRHREARMTFFAGLAEDYGRFSSPGEIMRAAGERVKAHLKISDCLFAEIDEARDTADVVYTSRSAELPGVLGAHRLSDFVSEEFRRAARAGETVVIRDTQTDPRTDARGYAALKIHSYVTVPFHHDGEWRFLFTVNDAAPRDWRADEIELIQEFASRIFPRLERARTEEALRSSEQRFRSLFDNSPDAVFLTVADGTVLAANPAACAMFGMTEEELCRAGRDGVSDPQDPRLAPMVLERLRTGQTRGELTCVRKDGSKFPGEVSSTIVKQTGQAFVIIRDITDRQRAEERLRLAQRLEAVGLLAGGIAHDFNNLLTSILGNASLVLGDVNAGVAGRIRDIVGSAERAANLTRQLLAYSGKGQFVVRDLNIAEAVREMGGLVRFSIPKTVQLSVSAEGRLPTVRMDPSQFQQLLMNMVINAGEAIGSGNPGRIAVVTALADVPAPFFDALGTEVAAGPYVTIEVSDTGVGMEEAMKSRIFEPFYTSKFTGRGLGLAAVAGIVRGLKGGITVRSEPGRGTSFRVYLPAAVQREVVAAEQGAGQETGTVLVVDDEPAVRDFIGAVLRREGYRVLLAGDGREALAVSERDGGTIDAAVVDVVMPRMDASGLLPGLKAKHPKVRVLLTSGYSEAEARRLCEIYAGAKFIQKPYTAQQIAAAVAELMPAKRRPRARIVPSSAD